MTLFLLTASVNMQSRHLTNVNNMLCIYMFGEMLFLSSCFLCTDQIPADLMILSLAGNPCVNDNDYQ